MKKLTAVLFVIVLFFSSFISSAYAHSGRTDGNGGHYNRSTGEYHYHHGYPAHKHENGECPYSFDDATVTNTLQNNDSEKNNSSFFLFKIRKTFKWQFADIFHLILCIIFSVLYYYGLSSFESAPKFIEIILSIVHCIILIMFSLSLDFTDSPIFILFILITAVHPLLSVFFSLLFFPLYWKLEEVFIRYFKENSK